MRLDVRQVEDRSGRRRGADSVDHHEVVRPDQFRTVHPCRRPGAPLSCWYEELDDIDGRAVESVQLRSGTVTRARRVTERQGSDRQALPPCVGRTGDSPHTRSDPQEASLGDPALKSGSGDANSIQFGPVDHTVVVGAEQGHPVPIIHTRVKAFTRTNRNPARSAQRFAAPSLQNAERNGVSGWRNGSG